MKEQTDLWVSIMKLPTVLPRRGQADPTDEARINLQTDLTVTITALGAACDEQRKSCQQLVSAGLKTWAAAAVNNGMGMAVKYAKP